MVDDEFEVCFELLLSVMLAKRRLKRVAVRVSYQSNIPGEPKKKKKNCSTSFLQARQRYTDT
jgi:hypothetical protein